MNAQDLKNSILQLAIQGKLVEQRKEEGTAKELLEQIKAEKEQLIKEKKIKKENPLPKITEDEIPFDIPESWEWSRVFNVADMYIGNSIAESVKLSKYTKIEEGYDYIATKDVGFDHLIDYENGVRIPFEEDKFRHSYKNSILMCIEGGSAGRKIGILDRIVCFGNKLCSFNAIIIETLYLYCYLQSPIFTQVFKNGISGIIGGVSINKLKTIIIPIPPLEEQKRIVAKIEELMPYIEKYGEAHSKLEKFNKKFPEDMQKSILQYAIQGKLVEQRKEEGTAEELYQQIQEEKARLIKEGKIKKEKPLAEINEEEIPFEIPESWKWVRLGEVASKLTDGSHNPPPNTGSGYYVISAKNIKNDEITFDNVERYTDENGFLKENLRTNITRGDIILGIIGGSIGNIAIYNHDERVIAQRSIAIINTLVCNKYIKNVIQSPLIQFQLKSSSGTAQGGVYLGTLNKIVVPLPPLQEQKRIVAKIEEMIPFCQQLVE